MTQELNAIELYLKSAIDNNAEDPAGPIEWIRGDEAVALALFPIERNGWGTAFQLWYADSIDSRDSIATMELTSAQVTNLWRVLTTKVPLLYRLAAETQADSREVR